MKRAEGHQTFDESSNRKDTERHWKETEKENELKGSSHTDWNTTSKWKKENQNKL